MHEGLPWLARVEVWDTALAALRAWFRAQGLREVPTPVRVKAPAVEPFIEPIAAQDGFLATSPELPMKRLLCRGSGSIFQVAHVFRHAERGANHSEEFHLIEWYRVRDRADGDLFRQIQDDVAALVAVVFEAVADLGVVPGHRPPTWDRVDCLGLMGETLGFDLKGDASAAFDAALRDVRERGVVTLGPGDEDTSANELARWTEFFSLWSDLELDPWLRRQAPGRAFHLVGFPAKLAALAEVDAGVAARFESHVDGVEIANGYRELRDAREQRRRFDEVNALRRSRGLAILPVDEDFLGDLAGPPGLPPCAGAALGLDRLLMLACGLRRLDHVSLGLGAP